MVINVYVVAKTEVCELILTRFCSSTQKKLSFLHYLEYGISIILVLKKKSILFVFTNSVFYKKRYFVFVS